jgi:HPt (histidine-containing phosphotransfer) domain-containing protein
MGRRKDLGLSGILGCEGGGPAGRSRGFSFVCKPKRKEKMAQMNANMQEKEIIIHADHELEDLLPGYLENRQGDIAKLLETLEKKDYETIRALGHMMKGSGSGYGFEGITLIGESLEMAAREKDEEAIRRAIGELTTYLNRIKIIHE